MHGMSATATSLSAIRVFHFLQVHLISFVSVEFSRDWAALSAVEACCGDAELCRQSRGKACFCSARLDAKLQACLPRNGTEFPTFSRSRITCALETWRMTP